MRLHCQQSRTRQKLYRACYAAVLCAALTCAWPAADLVGSSVPAAQGSGLTITAVSAAINSLTLALTINASTAAPLANAQLSLSGPYNLQFQTAQNLALQQTSTGVWQTQLTLPADISSGTWTVSSIQVTDTTGASTALGAQDPALQNARFDVNNPNGEITPRMTDIAVTPMTITLGQSVVYTIGFVVGPLNMLNIDPTKSYLQLTTPTGQTRHFALLPGADDNHVVVKFTPDIAGRWTFNLSCLQDNGQLVSCYLPTTALMSGFGAPHLADLPTWVDVLNPATPTAVPTATSVPASPTPLPATSVPTPTSPQQPTSTIVFHQAAPSATATPSPVTIVSIVTATPAPVRSAIPHSTPVHTKTAIVVAHLIVRPLVQPIRVGAVETLTVQAQPGASLTLIAEYPYRGGRHVVTHSRVDASGRAVLRLRIGARQPAQAKKQAHSPQPKGSLRWSLWLQVDALVSGQTGKVSSGKAVELQHARLRLEVVDAKS